MHDRAAVQISLSNLKHNYLRLREIHPSTEIFCTVKANAYGHGAVECVRALSECGAELFCVASAEEAFEIRPFTSGDILILGYTPPEYFSALSEKEIIQCVYSVEYAKLLEKASHGRKIRAHIAINTGMNRLGLNFRDFDGISYIFSSSAFAVEGAFTHLHSADKLEDVYTPLQFARFLTAIGRLDRPLMLHVSNSTALYKYSDFGLGYARAGLALYGFSDMDSGLLPVMKLSARVVEVNEVKRGECVGYDAAFIADMDMKIATVSMGYADGLSRKYQGEHLYIRGTPCRIIGKICMDACMLEIPSGLDAAEGDEAVVFDFDGKITKKLSGNTGLSLYEMLTSVGGRVKRIYRED